YCKEYLELIKYETDENTVILGLVFTALASDDLIASVKAAVASISQAEKTGIILSHIGKE
ncbi:MAG: hypothetical protein IJ297_06180, partial [Clostridia bacterium]|nr:hypothetical protein [Clostridia bacterium]